MLKWKKTCEIALSELKKLLLLAGNLIIPSSTKNLRYTRTQVASPLGAF